MTRTFGEARGALMAQRRRYFLGPGMPRHNYDIKAAASHSGVFVGAAMKSSIVKRSVALHGRRTSVSLEDAFWKALREIAYHQHISLSHLIESINTSRKQDNLSSAIRLFVLELYQDQIRSLKTPKPEIGRRRRVG